jgi:tetratricopeptide (TPR) repeat protein
MFRPILVVVTILLAPALASAQQDLMAVMQGFTVALGVTCDYCHSAPRGSGQPEPRKNIARAMQVLTREANAKVLEATGKEAAAATRVECITCHRGVPIPKQLTQILIETLVRDGPPAAISQYNDLRERFYGKASYDFGEDTLINVARRVIEVRPLDAVAVLNAHLEKFPNSAVGYETLAYAYTRKSDDANAIKYLEKALEIDPTNVTARGGLEQLKSFRRR